ncbi:MAG: hypothetical protein JXR76_13815 [Deltaproteobacteria bacterium]|nr:hypothetical protein [Deltaproteobacteria bacterium]
MNVAFFTSPAAILVHIAVYVALGSIYCPDRAEASDLLLLTPRESQKKHRALQDSLNAQLMDYNTTSKMYIPESPLEYDASTVADARRLQQQTGTKAVLWLNAVQFYLFVSVDDENHLFTRQLPENTGSWEVQCDAIAAVIQAMLSPWLTPAPAEDANEIQPSTPTETTVNGTPAKPALSDSNKRITEVKKRKRRFRNTSPLTLRPGIGAGFSPWVMSRKNVWSNGATAMLCLKVGRLLLFGIEPGIAFTSNLSFNLLRIPLRFRGELFWAAPSFSLGIGMSFILDVTRVSSSSSSQSFGNADGEIYFGMGASLSFTYNVNPIFSIVARVGGDLFQSANRYLYGENLIFYYGELQGRALLGVIFWLR